MKIIDISVAVDAQAWEPDPVIHEIMTPAQGAEHMAEEMKEFGLEISPSDLPNGELLSIDTLKLTSHTGTHVDAPSHYGSSVTYGDGVPRTIDQLPLDWFHRPGFVLDLTRVEEQVADAAYVKAELDRIGYTPQPMDIALLRTRASEWVGTPMYFSEFVGLDRSATELLLDYGVKVIGTDAFSVDAPFGDMITRYHQTQDQGVLWPAHFLGREREYCHIERLANLDTLPKPFGFTVVCFPFKVAGAGAGWTRAVAIFEDED
ncbi:cyclase family protein [Kitasatospora sp. NPDC101235]|uniref:cyclase family protein n=1 Tax=Kitasatospora sp. NPDC101235 TaxID=3364101 RepID=UPI0037F41741